MDAIGRLQCVQATLMSAEMLIVDRWSGRPA